MSILYPLKNQADDKTIIKTKTEYIANKQKYPFFDKMPYMVKSFFLCNGFIPKNEFEANNFINSIVGLNDKDDINIDYALTNILPKERFFTLNRNTFVYALYPNVWEKLTIEDRLHCINFAYRKILKDNNIKNDHRLIWVSSKNQTASGFVDLNPNVICVNFNSLLTGNCHSGLRYYSVLVHEINHIVQHNLSKQLITTPDKSTLSVYQQGLLSNNALTCMLNKENAKVLLDSPYREKYFEICDTLQWKIFLDCIYHCDYREIDSVKIQKQEFLKVAQKCYAFYGKNASIDKNIQVFIDHINSFGHTELLFDGLDNINNLKNLCGFVFNRLDIVALAIKKNETLSYNHQKKVSESLCKEYTNHLKAQKYILNTLVEICDNNFKFPKNFDYRIFNSIPKYIDLCTQSVDDLINKHKQVVDQQFNKTQTSYYL